MNLIGILLSLVLSSIAVLQQASVSAQLAKRDRGQQLTMEWFELQMNILQTLNRLPDCSNALVGSVVNAGTPTEVVFGLYQAGHFYEDLSLKHVQFVPVNTTNPIQWTGKLYLVIEKTGQFMGAPVVNHSFPITVSMASNVITGCM